MSLRTQDHRCPRCGAPLPVVTVQVPRYEECATPEGLEHVFMGYDDKEELADCVRCTGAY